MCPSFCGIRIPIGKSAGLVKRTHHNLSRTIPLLMVQKYSDVEHGKNGTRDSGQEGWNNLAVVQQPEIKIEVHDSSLAIAIYLLGNVRSTASPSFIGIFFCIVNVAGADRGDNKAAIVCTTMRTALFLNNHRYRHNIRQDRTFNDTARAKRSTRTFPFSSYFRIPRI
jgi:hypothetical protein